MEKALLCYYYLLLLLCNSTASLRTWRWVVGDRFTVEATDQARESCPDCVWSGCNTLTGVCPSGKNESWKLIYNETGEFVFGRPSGASVVDRLFVYKVKNGAVVCYRCFSLSVCPRGDGTALIHFNKHISNGIIQTDSCVLYRSKWNIIPNTGIGNEPFIDELFDVSNKYSVECYSTEIKFVIRSSQISNCSTPVETSDVTPSPTVFREGTSITILVEGTSSANIQPSAVIVSTTTLVQSTSTSDGMSINVSPMATGEVTTDEQTNNEGMITLILVIAVVVGVVVLIFLVAFVICLIKGRRRANNRKELTNDVSSEQGSVGYLGSPCALSGPSYTQPTQVTVEQDTPSVQPTDPPSMQQEITSTQPIDQSSGVPGDITYNGTTQVYDPNRIDGGPMTGHNVNRN